MRGSDLENSGPLVAQRPPRPKAYNPYEGREVTGKVETVLSRGRVIVETDKFSGKPGSGQFLKRKPRS
jgi:dihydroorotase-like cyclic amidohydrolase